jgi:hypothetical protein
MACTDFRVDLVYQDAHIERQGLHARVFSGHGSDSYSGALELSVATLLTFPRPS